METWNIGVDQLAALAAIGCTVLGAIVVAGLAARWTWRWILGTGRKPKKAEDAAPAAVLSPLPAAEGITAADLLVLKSNLLTVVRQIEDLDRRLRYGAAAQPTSNVVALKRN